MKKTINLYFDFKFTSLSPDAQPISLGIVSSIPNKKYPVGIVGYNKASAINYAGWNGLNPNNKNECILLYDPVDFKSRYFSKIILPDPVINKVDGYKLSDDMRQAIEHAKKTQIPKQEDIIKAFYAEFNDFDINRCDDWVKENVVNKLDYNHKEYMFDPKTIDHNEFRIKGTTNNIQEWLIKWLDCYFHDYNIQFVGDCATFDWYYLLKLIGEWNTQPICFGKPFSMQTTECHVLKGKLSLCPLKEYFPEEFDHTKEKFDCKAFYDSKIGLPQLPKNVSPVPQDLNDLIALKKGISIQEAFNENRVKLAYPIASNDEFFKQQESIHKHNALWDALIIKTIYNEL